MAGYGWWDEIMAGHEGGGGGGGSGSQIMAGCG